MSPSGELTRLVTRGFGTRSAFLIGFSEPLLKLLLCPPAALLLLLPLQDCYFLLDRQTHEDFSPRFEKNP